MGGYADPTHVESASVFSLREFSHRGERGCIIPAVTPRAVVT